MLKVNALFSNGISLLLIVSTMILGSYFTMKNTKSAWYDCIKPWYTPPAVVFPIAWTILYILLFFFLSRSILLGRWVKVGLMGCVLLLHVLWCYRYFGERQVGEGLLLIGLLNVINVLMVYVIVTMGEDVDEMRSDLWMFVPHVGWIIFATLLNAGSLGKLNECK